MRISLPYTHPRAIHEATSAWTLTDSGQLLVACGNGHVADVGSWDRDDDGNLTPSILCRTPQDGGAECGWHVFAHLEQWQKQGADREVRKDL